ncbi:Metallo-beta-lactamase domain-containing protein 1 [Podochytrium sp. JEL0797]|nr:Metallo-beta-lactamase domain-containing protein 1 [Podochytrium sp. JEL0797]
MTQVIQLRVGRANEQATFDWDVDCSVTLVRTYNLNMLFETGGSWAQDELISSLAKHSLCVSDITHVFCSHGHSDHVGCLSLFPDAMQIVGRDANTRSCYRNQQIPPSDRTAGLNVWEFESPEEEVSLRLITTPGHTGACVSLIGSAKDSLKMNFVYADGTSKSVSRFALVGDLWESNGDDAVWPFLSEMADLQRESRDFVLRFQPDVIVPGHGPAFTPQ